MIKRKKIRYISLHLDCHNGLISDDLRIQFNENSRFISNYLSKEVRKLNIESVHGDYKMISVTPRKEGISYQFLAENVLSVHPQLSKENLARYYQTKNLELRYEFYLSLLEDGYRISEPLTGIPTEKLLFLHQQFRENEYKNEWLVKQLSMREYGIKLLLMACFTHIDYHLRLTVYNIGSKEEVSNSVIYRTPPYEVCYERDIRKVYIQDGFLYIDDFLGRHFLRLSIEDICRGKNTAERLQPGGYDYEESIQRLIW